MKLIFGYKETTYVYDSETAELRQQTKAGSVPLPTQHPALKPVIYHAEMILAR